MTAPVKERRDCSDCISHLQHAEAIATLKTETKKTEAGLKDKVSDTHFKWAIGLMVTVIVMVSYLNYNTMTRILDSNHSVVTKVAVIEADIKGIRDSLAFRTEEHSSFKEEILMLRQNYKSLDERIDELR